ncbi:protein L [Pseudomonas sp. MF6394]|uniref:protein L n=1 Tax=unclassified Pseudomonas TaxID=196821 RepID=UPI00099759E6|nr:MULTISPECIES: protein L [unclassified Pseudomonas]MEC4240805.1 protein L [Pseudomonas sp. DSV-1]OOV93106.1 protein L [Pseudomonas sp. MF6394]
MAYYTDKSVFQKITNPHEIWGKEFGPAEIVPVSGIYRCTGCNKEVTSNHGDKFPPQNHHQHTLLAGPIKWKINVWTNTEGK